MLRTILALASALTLMACGDTSTPPTPEPPKAQPAPAAEQAVEAPASDTSDRLEAVLAAQPEKAQARYGARHPQQTLEFFGIEPGMTVVEALPGNSGWYTKILLPFVGTDGKVIGVDYAQALFPLFGFYSEEALEAKKTWRATWLETAEPWRGEDGAQLDAFVFGSMPESARETADAVLMIRALHNLFRFEEQGGFLTDALTNAFDVLKPGGLLGVVQHEARPDTDDAWANGSNGYLKQASVIARLEQAGFEFVAESNINANPKDQPTTEDKVWRLPPSMVTSRDNPALREQMLAIGESNRMTLLFRKPGQ